MMSVFDDTANDDILKGLVTLVKQTDLLWVECYVLVMYIYKDEIMLEQMF